MIISRALPILIRLNYVIKSNTSTQKNFSKHLLKKFNPGSVQQIQFRIMSSKVDEDLNDPKRHLDYKQLNEKNDKGEIVIIDVREHSEVKETGKIPGSIHIPLNEIKGALADLKDGEFLKMYESPKPKIDDEIVFTCRSVAEVKKALGEMSDEDFKKKYNASKPLKEQEVVFSCKAGTRSVKALKIGLELGYSKAANYKGGWLDWAEKSGKTK